MISVAYIYPRFLKEENKKEEESQIILSFCRNWVEKFIFFRELGIKRCVLSHSSYKPANSLLTIVCKVGNYSIKFHWLQSEVKFLVALASKRNLRMIISHTPIENFIFHTMASLNKVMSQMLCGNGNSNTGLCPMSGNILFCNVLIFLVIKVS